MESISATGTRARAFVSTRVCLSHNSLWLEKTEPWCCTEPPPGRPCSLQLELTASEERARDATMLTTALGPGEFGLFLLAAFSNVPQSHVRLKWELLLLSDRPHSLLWAARSVAAAILDSLFAKPQITATLFLRSRARHL